MADAKHLSILVHSPNDRLEGWQDLWLEGGSGQEPFSLWPVNRLIVLHDYRQGDLVRLRGVADDPAHALDRMYWITGDPDDVYGVTLWTGDEITLAGAVAVDPATLSQRRAVPVRS